MTPRPSEEVTESMESSEVVVKCPKCGTLMLKEPKLKNCGKCGSLLEEQEM